MGDFVPCVDLPAAYVDLRMRHRVLVEILLDCDVCTEDEHDNAIADEVIMGMTGPADLQEAYGELYARHLAYSAILVDKGIVTEEQFMQYMNRAIQLTDQGIAKAKEEATQEVQEAPVRKLILPLLQRGWYMMFELTVDGALAITMYSDRQADRFESCLPSAAAGQLASMLSPLA